jgi:hypothetical protein
MWMRLLCAAVALLLPALAYPAHAPAGTVTNAVNAFDYEAAPGETNHLVIRGDTWDGYRVKMRARL